jgi:hypothetical protein
MGHREEARVLVEIPNPDQERRCRGTAGAATESLMQRADAALYRAKNRGRNCFEVFAAGWDERPEGQDKGQEDTESIVPKA